MLKKRLLDQSLVRELFNYDELTGLLTRKIVCKAGGGSFESKQVGAVVGTTSTTNGYYMIGVNGKLHYTHKIIFLWITGKWMTVKHIDGVRTNNQRCNLRGYPKANDNMFFDAERLLWGAYIKELKCIYYNKAVDNVIMMRDYYKSEIYDTKRSTTRYGKNFLKVLDLNLKPEKEFKKDEFMHTVYPERYFNE